tara:strand:- start:2930 stop:3397 length:468 start_codon:yes stop_codon:yes gene_type:complete
MKTYQKLSFVLICFCVLSSCKKENRIIKAPVVSASPAATYSCEYSVEFDIHDLFTNGNTEGFTIEDWRIEGSSMRIVIKAMGVDGSTWEPKLIDPLNVLDIDPPKHALKLVLEINEEQSTEITKEFCFKMIPYSDGQSTINYTFVNVGESFNYSY